MSKRALDLGHIRFGQEVSMAEVVEVENVETQDCEFISEKMSEAPFSTCNATMLRDKLCENVACIT